MTGHAVKNAQTVAGALSGSADRSHESSESSLDRMHEAGQKALDRDSVERTTAATLGTQQKIAKTKK
jgi:hypothetical protein